MAFIMIQTVWPKRQFEKYMSDFSVLKLIRKNQSDGLALVFYFLQIYFIEI